jgi:hypothetical protein
LARAGELNPTDATLLACSSKLRREFSAELARAALDTVLLRRKAAAKFSRSDEMYFTREALEQSSGEVIARYRAERFPPFAAVADFCCGIGGDSLALAADHAVTAIDVDPLRLAMAEHNVRVYYPWATAHFIAGDLLEMTLPDVEAIFFDPDRRADGQRQISPSRYRPEFHHLRQRLRADTALGVKMAPAVAWHDLHKLDAEIEFISVDGELKECVAWFGPFKGPRRRATLLPERATLSADEPAVGSVGEPGKYLYDPDPAVVRSGLVTNLAATLDARVIDAEIAYLTSDKLQATPFAALYRIDEVHPFHVRKLAKRLLELRVGRITVTKRGSVIDPATLIRRLKLDGPEHRTVILTRVRGKPIMFIGEKLSPGPDTLPESGAESI